MVCLGKSIQPLQNDTLSYLDYSVSGSSSQQCPGIPSKDSCLFSSILFHYKNLSRQSVIKVPNQYTSHMTLSHRIQAKTFTWPDTSFYARKVTLICQSNESNTSAPGRVVINISVHLVLLFTSAFSNWLIGIYLHCILWCIYQVTKNAVFLFFFFFFNSMMSSENLLLFTIWRHPLQMREYLLRYTGTDGNNKNPTYVYRLF